MSNTKVPQINKILITGNLCWDPEFRKTANGTPVANFRIASSRRFKGFDGTSKEETCYIGVVAWARLAESCKEFLKKGSAVFIEGELQSKDIIRDDGGMKSSIEINAYKIQFLNKREEESYQDYSPEDNIEDGNR